MDSSITLSYGSNVTSTIVSNIFIDKYMTDARGSDVKVYLYLLRCLQDPSVSITIESIAEALDETEKDIRTSLKYWDKQDVLSVHYYRDGRIKSINVHDLDTESEESEASPYDEDSNITLLSSHRPSAREIAVPSMRDGKPYGRRVDDEYPRQDEYTGDYPAFPKSFSKSAAKIPSKTDNIRKNTGEFDPDVHTSIDKAIEPEHKEKPNYSMKMIQSFKDNYPEFDSLIDYVESAFGKTLTTKDLQTISFIFEELGFPTDLIRYLYDYCIAKGKKTSSYIEKVAREWHSKGINTINKATQDIDEFSNRFAVIKTAFGLNRQLLDAELKYARKWADEYGFSDEMIREACDRTVLNTSKTDFRYANKILTDWHSQGFTTLDEVKSSENETFISSARNKTVQRNTKKAVSDYSQRIYSEEDYVALEKKKLGIQ